MFNHSNMFRPPSRSHHQGVQNPWELQSHCGDLLECCYVYVFTLRCDCCGMLSIPQQSHRDVNTYTQQHSNWSPQWLCNSQGFWTSWWWLRLGGRNMLEWLNNNKLIQKLICAFCWFILFFIIENALSKKKKLVKLFHFFSVFTVHDHPDNLFDVIQMPNYLRINVQSNYTTACTCN